MARKRRRRVSAAAQDPLDAILGDTTGVILCSRTSLRYGRHRDDRDLCHLRCPVPASSSMMASASKLRFTLSVQRRRCASSEWKGNYRTLALAGIFCTAAATWTRSKRHVKPTTDTNRHGA